MEKEKGFNAITGSCGNSWIQQQPPLLRRERSSLVLLRAITRLSLSGRGGRTVDGHNNHQHSATTRSNTTSQAIDHNLSSYGTTSAAKILLQECPEASSDVTLYSSSGEEEEGLHDTEQGQQIPAQALQVDTPPEEVIVVVVQEEDNQYTVPSRENHKSNMLCAEAMRHDQQNTTSSINATSNNMSNMKTNHELENLPNHDIKEMTLSDVTLHSTGEDEDVHDKSQQQNIQLVNPLEEEDVVVEEGSDEQYISPLYKNQHSNNACNRSELLQLVPESHNLNQVDSTMEPEDDDCDNSLDHCDDANSSLCSALDTAASSISSTAHHHDGAGENTIPFVISNMDDVNVCQQYRARDDKLGENLKNSYRIIATLSTKLQELTIAIAKKDKDLEMSQQRIEELTKQVNNLLIEKMDS